MLLYSPHISPRLQYIAAFAAQELLGAAITLTDSLEEYREYAGIKINYSPEELTDRECWIVPQGLLAQTTIEPQHVEVTEEQGMKIFFATAGNFPFDLFAAAFYLLSRYEEYLPHRKDMYGRYAHEQSLAYCEGFLHQPLVNIWGQCLVSRLKELFPGHSFASKGTVVFLPTYDIDMAWSYRHKGFWRNAGGLVKDLLAGRLSLVKERVAVLRGRRPDPFDAYGWMNRLHEQHRLAPYYFFPLAARTARYDKNISPRNKAFRALVNDHVIRYPVGIHPSWQSGDNERLLSEEIAMLAGITGHEVKASRQHFIRFTLPQTFRQLLQQGIRFDFSMGYGSINGFRASVASPFLWYDLANDTATELLLFPFCFMDANSFHEQQDTPQQALDEMRRLFSAVSQVNGLFSMIWHNTFLGTGAMYAGWREAYATFISEAAVQQAPSFR